MSRYAVEPGVRHPLGAVPDAAGVNFSIFSRHADGMDLLLFDSTRFQIAFGGLLILSGIGSANEDIVNRGKVMTNEEGLWYLGIMLIGINTFRGCTESPSTGKYNSLGVTRLLRGTRNDLPGTASLRVWRSNPDFPFTLLVMGCRGWPSA